MTDTSANRLPPADIDLTSAQVRRELPARAKPYWHISTPGVHLGYYKGGRGAAWYGRKFVGEGRYRQTKLGPSRDEDAGGGLSFVEALEALVAWASDGAPTNGTPAAPAPREGRRQAERAAKQLQPTRLDTISRAWAQERPDVDFWLAGFFLRLEYAHYLHDRRVQEVAKQAGANVGDLHVLLALRRNGPGVAMRPTDLYRELLVTSGAITKRLDNLRAQNLIERVADAGDRRSELVRLTASGQAVADAAMTRITESLKRIVAASGLGREELVQLDEGFRRLIAAM